MSYEPFLTWRRLAPISQPSCRPAIKVSYVTWLLLLLNENRELVECSGFLILLKWLNVDLYVEYDIFYKNLVDQSMIHCLCIFQFERRDSIIIVRVVGHEGHLCSLWSIHHDVILSEYASRKLTVLHLDVSPTNMSMLGRGYGSFNQPLLWSV